MHESIEAASDASATLVPTILADCDMPLIAAVRALRGDSRVALVLTLRADFYASLMESAQWADLDGQLSRLDVSPLRGDKLRLAIEAPARALGVYFEPVLVERLLHEVADEPGALPLLQDTLLELWHRRTRGLLRLAEYDAMSDGMQTGLAVTMTRRADGALSDLSPARRGIAQRVLLRLVQAINAAGDRRPASPGAPTVEQKRGFAIGLTEFAGYFAVAGSALATGFVAAHVGLRPQRSTSVSRSSRSASSSPPSCARRSTTWRRSRSCMATFLPRRAHATAPRRAGCAPARERLPARRSRP